MPEGQRRWLDLGELWAHRELLAMLALKDIQVRYRQTVAGAAWALLQPLLTMLVFSVIFGHFARMPSDGVPYPVFALAGLLPWQFFAAVVHNASASLVGQANLVTRIYFPRLLLPVSVLGAALVDLAIAILVLLVVMLAYGMPWQPGMLALPVLVLAASFTALGVGTLMAALTVSYRDFRFVVPFMLQIWLFASPVIYPPSLVPEGLRWLLYLNPMAGVIDGFRAAFLGRQLDAGAVALSLAVASAVFVLAIAYFRRVERRFADVI